MKLYDKLPIEIWKNIAIIVQNLTIEEFTEQEFFNNLEILNRELEEINICGIGELNPTNVTDIGTIILLKNIYQSRVNNDYKLAHFYEFIEQIEDLGMKYLEFRPVKFPKEITHIELIKDIFGENIAINKAITDGEFNDTYPINCNYCNMINIENATYIMQFYVRKLSSGTPSIDNDSCIILKNFDGILPNKKTVLDIDYPEISFYIRKNHENKRHTYSKQLFLPYKREDKIYQRERIKKRNSYYYD